MRLHSALMASKSVRSAAAKKASEARWSKKRGRSMTEVARLLGYTRQALHTYRTRTRPWPPGLKKRYEELMRESDGK